MTSLWSADIQSFGHVRSQGEQHVQPAGDSGIQRLSRTRHDALPGRFESAEPLAGIYSRAESLAENHSARLGTRSMDILHVAAAEYLNCSQFITGDQRQARLAEAIDLPLVFQPPS